MTQDNPFEFSSSDDDFGFCIAGDVIHDGKLLPLIKTQTHPRPNGNYRRCESEGDNRSGRPTGGGISDDPTAEHGRLRRAASEPTGGPRRAPPPASKARVRPRWYWFAFSSAGVPAEMDMENIKSRFANKSRRPDLTAEGSAAWRVVRSLSCKGAESTAVVDAVAVREGAAGLAHALL